MSWLNVTTLSEPSSAAAGRAKLGGKLSQPEALFSKREENLYERIYVCHYHTWQFLEEEKRKRKPRAKPMSPPNIVPGLRADFGGWHYFTLIKQGFAKRKKITRYVWYRSGAVWPSFPFANENGNRWCVVHEGSRSSGFKRKMVSGDYRGKWNGTITRMRFWWEEHLLK